MLFHQYVDITKKTQMEIAKEIGEPQSSVSLWYTRKRNIPYRPALKIEEWSGGAVTLKDCATNKAA